MHRNQCCFSFPMLLVYLLQEIHALLLSIVFKLLEKDKTKLPKLRRVCTTDRLKKVSRSSGTTNLELRETITMIFSKENFTDFLVVTSRET